MEQIRSQLPPTRPRRWPWFVLGLLSGTLAFALSTVLFPPAPQRYVLIRDVQIHDLYFFAGDHPAPIQGVIRSGTEFTLTGRNSVEYFLSFEIPVNGPDFAVFCRPLPGTSPFLAPIHENRPTTAAEQSSSAASSTKPDHPPVPHRH